MIRKKPNLRRHTDAAGWIRGSANIAEALGVARANVAELVDKHNLPAFKYLGRWTVIATDLPGWMQHIKRHHYQGPKTRKRPQAPTGRRPGP